MAIVPQTVVDQQLAQLQNVRALTPANGPNVVGIDGSRTAPQVSSLVGSLDGELPRPATIGNDFYLKARRIRRDPTIRLARELSMAPLLMASWEYEDKPDAPPGAKELVTEIMNDLRLPLMRSSMCGQIDYGWQPFEIIAEGREDGATAPRLKPLLQDLTSILVNAADGAYFGLRQNPYAGLNTNWVYLLEDESFVISQDVEGTNWYGEPTLRSIESVWDETETIRKNSRKYDAKIAGTHWVIYYPLGTSNYGGVEMDNGALAKELLAQAESVGGIAVPRSVLQAVDAMNAAAAEKESTQWKIELLSDEGSGQTSFMDKLKYLDTLKVRAFGLPERAVLEGQFGTKAEAQAHADIAVANMEVKHALMCYQFNAKLVDKILAWNYGPDAKGSVKIKPAPLADDTLAFFKQIYLALLTNPQGFMTEVSTMDLQRLRDKLGVPGLKYDPMTAYNVDPYAEIGGGADPALGGGDPLMAMLNYGGGQGAQPAQGVGFSREATAIADAAELTVKPSKPQAKAGNYRKGKANIHGLTISIENPKGTRRKPEWPKLPAHYGYINRTEGADGDHVDVFVGKHADSEMVYIIDQCDKSGEFDEHKIMLGFKNQKKAVQAYRDSYNSGHCVGPVTAMTMAAFKRWLDGEGSLMGPVSANAKGLGLAFDPNEPRDAQGQWTTDGGDNGHPYNVYPLKMKGADGNPKTMYAVQSLDNFAKGVKAGFGDSVFGSEEEANQHAARQFVNKNERQKYLDKAAEKEAAEKAAKDAKYGSLGSFTEGMTPHKTAKAVEYLHKPIRYDGKETSIKTLIEKAVKEEKRKITTYEGKRVLEHEDGRILSEKSIGKIGMDYASHLLDS